MKQDFQFSVDRISVNTDLMKMCATQSKNGVMINFNLNIGNQLTGVFVKKIIYVIIVHVIVSMIKDVKLLKLMDNSILKIVHAKIIFLISQYQHVKTRYKKQQRPQQLLVKRERIKKNYLIHTISLLITCLLLLVVISFSCYHS